MINGPWRFWDVYYYGQDRLGTWPLVGLKVLAHFRPVSLQTFNAFSAVWVFSGVIPAALLGAGCGHWFALAYLLALLVLLSDSSMHRNPIPGKSRRSCGLGGSFVGQSKFRAHRFGSGQVSSASSRPGPRPSAVSRCSFWRLSN